MTRIIVDSPLADQLQSATNLVELCDPSGRVLGSFSPARDPSQYEPREPQISEEELERRRQSTTWYTTEEVLKHLENL